MPFCARRCRMDGRSCRSLVEAAALLTSRHHSPSCSGPGWTCERSGAGISAVTASRQFREARMRSCKSANVGSSPTACSRLNTRLLYREAVLMLGRFGNTSLPLKEVV